MKRLIIIAIQLSFMLGGGCNAQKKKNELSLKQLVAVVDTTAKPKIDVKVNRKYDNNGNLIQYDSTYSYFYSSPGFNNGRISSDSLFKNFKAPLMNDYRGKFNENLNNIFFNDTLFKYDFFDTNYFSKRFQMNMNEFENVFRQMDSIKTKMLREEYPKGSLKKN